MKKLTKLKVDKSPGPDRMHPHVLLRLQKELVTPLTKLFQHSAASGILPAVENSTCVLEEAIKKNYFYS